MFFLRTRRRWMRRARRLVDEDIGTLTGVGNNRRNQNGGTVADDSLGRNIHHRIRDRGFRYRSYLLVAAIAYFVPKALQFFILPWGPAAYVNYPESYRKVQASEDQLRLKHGKVQRIFERLEDDNEDNDATSDTPQRRLPLLKGPETVVIQTTSSSDEQQSMETIYVLTEDAKLLKVTDIRQPSPDDPHTLTARFQETGMNLGLGRPLGGKFAAVNPHNTDTEQTLYIADAILGLTRLANVSDPSCKLEIVASAFRDPDKSGVVPKNPAKDMQRLIYVNDVAIGPISGKVYFTSSTDIIPKRLPHKNSWDTMYMSKLDFLRGKPAGRLLEYDPATREVKVLADNIAFANGVAVDRDEKYVVVAETFGIRLWKYRLEDADDHGADDEDQDSVQSSDSFEGDDRMEVVLANSDMTGYLDGVDCAWEYTKEQLAEAQTDEQEERAFYCYAAVPSHIIPLHKLMLWLPAGIHRALRTAIMTLPPALFPPLIHYGGVVQVDPLTHRYQYLQDPDGTDVRMVNGVTAHRNKLYLGSLHNKYIAVYDLS